MRKREGGYCRVGKLWRSYRRSVGDECAGDGRGSRRRVQVGTDLETVSARCGLAKA